MNIKRLKEFLRFFHLNSTGEKEDLQARLLAFLQKPASSRGKKKMSSVPSKVEESESGEDDAQEESEEWESEMSDTGANKKRKKGIPAKEPTHKRQKRSNKEPLSERQDDTAESDQSKEDSTQATETIPANADHLAQELRKIIHSIDIQKESTKSIRKKLEKVSKVDLAPFKDWLKIQISEIINK